jgi:hypothetical protein
VSPKNWAEAGEWTRGKPALLVMRGEYDGSELVDPPVTVHCVPIDDINEWEAALAALGYRKTAGAREEATEYGIAFDVEAAAS